jgi:hypothetical protein
MKNVIYYTAAGIMAALTAGITAAVVVLLLRSPDRAPATPQPQAFTSAAGGFSVMAPGPVEEKIQSLDIPLAGKIDMHAFNGHKGNISYVVAYADYPVEIVSQRDPEKVLDGSRDGMVGNINGKLLTEFKISIDGYPGREIVVDTKIGDGQDATIKARLYLVGNRLYQLIALAPKGEGLGDMQPFLESFALLPK